MLNVAAFLHCLAGRSEQKLDNRTMQLACIPELAQLAVAQFAVLIAIFVGHDYLCKPILADFDSSIPFQFVKMCH